MMAAWGILLSRADCQARHCHISPQLASWDCLPVPVSEQPRVRRGRWVGPIDGKAADHPAAVRPDQVHAEVNLAVREHRFCLAMRCRSRASADVYGHPPCRTAVFDQLAKMRQL